MPKIEINLKQLAQLKDKVFAQAVENATGDAIRSVLLEEARRNISRTCADPEVLTEPDSDGYIWIGNDGIRVKVYADSFIDDITAQVAEDL